MEQSAGNTTEDPNKAKLITWVENTLGGNVTAIERQARWRPVYFIGLDQGGSHLELVARCERLDLPMTFPLKHEMTLQKLLHEQGIPTAKVYGWCDDPKAYVMAKMPGEDSFGPSATAAEKRTVLRAYTKVIAEMHQLPLEPFRQAGILHADSPQHSTLVGQRQYETMYRNTKLRPDPFLEFMLGWVHRNPLEASGRESVVTWDCGQFHHVGDKLTGILDVELGHIGEPMMDLAGMRIRSMYLGWGLEADMLDWYEEFTGQPVDLEAVKYHFLFFNLSSALSCHAPLADPPLGSDYMVNRCWVYENSRHALSTLAEILNIPLPQVDLPETMTTDASLASQHMVNSLQNLKTADTFLQHEIDVLARLAEHQQRFNESGQQAMEADLEDMKALLGYKPANWLAGEQALEDFVLNDNGKHDEALILLFNKRLQRGQALNGPPGSEMRRHAIYPPFVRNH